MTRRNRPADGAGDHRWTASDAAGFVFERFAAELDGGGGSPTERRSPVADIDGSGTGGLRARASLARSIDTYAELLQRVFTSFASDVDRALTVQEGGANPPTPVTLVGLPGSVVGAVVWIHNTSGSSVPEFTLRMTGLFRADGARVSPDLGSTDPDRFEASMEPRRSAWVSLAVPARARPGSYYGHLLAQGLPDVAVPLRLVVR